VMTFFPNNASGEALSATADVQGFAFTRAVERLTDLALLDVQQVDLSIPPRYALHPLVRAFAGARIAENNTDFERSARTRWVNWYVGHVSKARAAWNDLSRLAVLDPEYEAIQAVTEWSLHNQYYAETIQIAKDSDYYYHVRGLWNEKLKV